jgi:hypothetical protein
MSLLGPHRIYTLRQMDFQIRRSLHEQHPPRRRGDTERNETWSFIFQSGDIGKTMKPEKDFLRVSVPPWWVLIQRGCNRFLRWRRL